MKKLFILSATAVIIAGLSSCNRINTLPTTNIFSFSATLGGLVNIDKSELDELKVGIMVGIDSTFSGPHIEQSINGSEMDSSRVFYFTFDNLVPETKFYYCAFTSKLNGEKREMGNIMSFTTHPIIETLEAKDITTSSASLNGFLGIPNKYDNGSVGIVWSPDSLAISHYPPMNMGDFRGQQELISVAVDTTHVFKFTFDNLIPATKYYYRAYYALYTEPVNGEVKSFTTASAVSAEGVQLWENGPYWSPYNIGAEKPEEYGQYFYWGDTVGYVPDADGKFSCPPYGSLPAYYEHDKITPAVSIPTDYPASPLQVRDAARKNWGDNWRMPSIQEFYTLMNKDNSGKTDGGKWTTDYNDSGVNGLVISGTGDYSDKSIFIPAAGGAVDFSLSADGIIVACWSSTHGSGEPILAFALLFSSSNTIKIDERGVLSRLTILPIRPVHD